LIEGAVAQDFGSQPKIRYAPEGLSYEIEVPLSVIATSDSGGGSEENGDSDGKMH
jgi:hypothetical protein